MSGFILPVYWNPRPQYCHMANRVMVYMRVFL